MAITVVPSQVRERCGIDHTDWDAEIATLIGELVTPIEYALRPDILASTDPGLVATLNLAALEIVAGEFFVQIARKPGYFDAVSILGFELTPFVRGPAADLSGLKAQGWARLAPYLRVSPPGLALTSSGRASAGEDE